MIVFPPCKINLGLNIKEKRPDGYHNLESVFYPLPLTDGLEAIENTNNPNEIFSIQFSGITIPGNPLDNLVSKAYHLLHADFDLPPVIAHLHKVIPMGAGLGGGSADGASMLLLLNEKFNLQIKRADLMNYAARLGSDCPFFIDPTPSFVSGRGEFVEPIPFSLSGKHLLLVNPGIHVSTAEAFSMVKFNSTSIPVGEVIFEPIVRWKELLVNDFEISVFPRYQKIREIKEVLYAMGAEYASMTGTGSTVYGIFPDFPEIPMHFGNYFTKVLSLS